MITRLDSACARKLSAGQVITDLSSVLKELVENSLDAGAQVVTIRIDNYGLDSIIVEDDGCGIALPGLLDDTGAVRHDGDAVSIPLLACRATTKYDHGAGGSEVQVRDSLGFRGEALHSLAHVSEVTVHTMTADTQPVTISITYDSRDQRSNVRASRERQGPGTTVVAANLFRILPVRHGEFNKNKKKQLINAVSLVKQYALSHPHVRLLMTHRVEPQCAPATLVSLTGTSDAQRALAEAYGGRYVSNMARIEWSLSFGVLTGFVSRVGGGRLSSDMQVCALDGRLVDLPRLAKAISDAFAECHPNAAQRVYPVFFLQLTCGNDVAYDINLAPNKRKVLFTDEDTRTEEVRARALQTFQTSTDGIEVARHTRIANVQQMDWRATQQTQLARTPVSATSLTQFSYRRAPAPTAGNDTPSDSGGGGGGSPGTLNMSSTMCSSLYHNLTGVASSTASSAADDTDGDNAGNAGDNTHSSSGSGSWSNRESLEKSDEACSEAASGASSPTPSRKRDRSPVPLTDDSNQPRSAGPRVPLLFPTLSELSRQPLTHCSGGSGRGGALPPKAFAGLAEQTERELALCLDKAAFAAMTVHGQFNHGFILASYGDELFVIDQHAADEKYNYERLMAQYTARPQPLVAPVPVPMDPHDVYLALQHASALRQHGFIVREGTEDHRLLVEAVPVLQYEVVGPHDVTELVQQLVLYGTITRPLRSVWHSMATRACRSSIMIGTVLADKTMHNVVHRLGDLDQPWCCPHGRPTLRHVATISALGTK